MRTRWFGIMIGSTVLVAAADAAVHVKAGSLPHVFSALAGLATGAGGYVSTSAALLRGVALTLGWLAPLPVLGTLIGVPAVMWWRRRQGSEEPDHEAVIGTRVP